MLRGSLKLNMYFLMGTVCSALIALANPGHFEDFPKTGTSRMACTDPPADKLEGCPESIPIVDKDHNENKILAGRVWNPSGGTSNPDNIEPKYKIPELGCKGQCHNWYANTKSAPDNKNEKYVFVSVIINAGCTLHVFEKHDFTGQSYSYLGPKTIINPAKGGPIQKCSNAPQYKDMPCVGAMLWSCNQTLPSCTFDDSWETIATIDNLKQTETVQFTYEKVVGTQFSVSITKSMSVSASVSATLTAQFWLIAAAFGVSGTTGYNWEKVDSESKSESRSYNVNIKVPGKKKILIQEVVGICKGAKKGAISSVHTQSFRVVDAETESVLQKYNGMMTSYQIPKKRQPGRWKGKGKRKSKGKGKGK